MHNIQPQQISVSSETVQHLVVGVQALYEQQQVAQEQQRAAQERTDQTLVLVCAELAVVKEKLDIIDKNVLSVPGLVMSAFANMSEETKAHAEEELLKVMEPEVLEEIVELVMVATEEIEKPEDSTNTSAMLEYRQAIKRRAVARAVGKQRIAPAKLEYWTGKEKPPYKG